MVEAQFNADPAIVGKAFDMNGQQTTVIGVLPRSFDFGAVFSPGAKVDAITPLNLYGPPRDWGNIITMIGRLKPGVTLAQARKDADAAAPHMCWNNKNPQSCGSMQARGSGWSGSGAAEGLCQREAASRRWWCCGRRWAPSADRLREPVEPAAGSRRLAQQGVCDARRAGREPRAHRAPTADGEPGAVGAGAVLGLGLALVVVVWLAHQGSIALPLLSTPAH
jgi:hypothetical protein